MSNPQSPQRGPERFAAAPLPIAPRVSPLARLGAVLALLVLVVGVPVALLMARGGIPVPTSWPSRDDLTQPITTDLLLDILVIVVWLAWLQFTVCVVVEAVALLRGGGLPHAVPLAGRSQALARSLVGTVLVGATLIGSATAANAAEHAPGHSGFSSPGVSATQAVQDAHGTLAAAERQADQQAGQQAGQQQGDHGRGPAAPSTEGAGFHRGMVKSTIVQPPQGRYHDSLWDIAERHLGDGRRWHEIFELNKGRLQADGQRLEIGRLIQPGWVLELPDDATGPGVIVGGHHLVDGADGAGGAGGHGGGASANAGSGAGAAQQVSDHAADGAGGAAGGASQATAGQSSGVDLATDLAGGGLLAAALVGLIARERRRRRGADLTAAEIEDEVAARVGADTDRAERLDHALRRLVVNARNADIPLPSIYAVTVDDERIELRIAPESPDAPAPWAVAEEGRRWRLERAAGEADQGETGNAPYPGLVCVGRDDAGADVLIDLEAVGGIAAVGGSDAVAREVVSAMAAQLVTVPWADDQLVYAHDLTEDLATLDHDRLGIVDDMAAFVPKLVSRHRRRSGSEVLAGRGRRRPDVTPQYLMFGTPPDSAVVADLQPLVHSGDRGLGVVSVGTPPGARWQLTVDESGHLTLPLLDIAVTAVRLTERSAASIAEILDKARDAKAAPTGLDLPVPPRDGDDAHWATAPVRVGVLGRLETRVPASIDPDREALASEILAYLAVQTAPVHPNVLAGAIWPRGVTPEVRDASIARVRDWLGNASDGTYLLREDEGGRLYLSDEVAVDWHAFCVLVRQSWRQPGQGEAEMLRRALQLVRGPLLDGRERTRYSWLPRTRLETTVADAVEAAAHRLVQLCGTDPDGAAAAARAGLRLVRRSQLLWRDLLHAEADSDEAGRLTAAIDEMAAVLDADQVDPEPETEALLAELAPPSRQVS